MRMPAKETIHAGSVYDKALSTPIDRQHVDVTVLGIRIRREVIGDELAIGREDCPLRLAPVEGLQSLRGTSGTREQRERNRSVAVVERAEDVFTVWRPVP